MKHGHIIKPSLSSKISLIEWMPNGIQLYFAFHIPVEMWYDFLLLRERGGEEGMWTT